MTRSAKQFKLDKLIWTEADFDSMAWHDNPIHAITFSDNFELLLDIDYIFEWVLKGKKYVFWISPCTWIFENVYDSNLTLDQPRRDLPLILYQRKTRSNQKIVNTLTETLSLIGQ